MSQKPQPQGSVSESESNNKGFMANLSKSAGAATKMVALQTERTKLATMTLPTAYRALGKDCLQQKRHLDCVTELTEQLRSVLAEIKKLAEAGAEQPAPQSFTDKAKAAGKYAVDAARQKQLGMKRDGLIANIGKAIYEKHLDTSGPNEFAAPLQKITSRIAEIDAEIGKHSQVGKGTFITPKRIAVISSFIIGACLLFYFLFFVFLSEPRLSVEYYPFIPGRERQYTKDRIQTVYQIKENADFTYVSSRGGKKLEGPPGKYFIRNGCVFAGGDTPEHPALPLVKIGAKVGDKWSIPSTKTEGEIVFCFDKVEIHQGKSYVVVHQTYVYPNGNAWGKIIYYFYKGVGLVHRRNYRFDDRTQKWQLESELSYKEWEW